MVELEPLELDDREWLVETIERHHELTDSALAAYLLSDWDQAVRRFRKVMPRDYKRVQSVMREAELSGVSLDEAHGRVMVAALQTNVKFAFVELINKPCSLATDDIAEKLLFFVTAPVTYPLRSRENLTSARASQ